MQSRPLPPPLSTGSSSLSASSGNPGPTSHHQSSAQRPPRKRAPAAPRSATPLPLRRAWTAIDPPDAAVTRKQPHLPLSLPQPAFPAPSTQKRQTPPTPQTCDACGTRAARNEPSAGSVRSRGSMETAPCYKRPTVRVLRAARPGFVRNGRHRHHRIPAPSPRPAAARHPPAHDSSGSAHRTSSQGSFHRARSPAAHPDNPRQHRQVQTPTDRGGQSSLGSRRTTRQPGQQHAPRAGHASVNIH